MTTLTTERPTQASVHRGRHTLAGTGILIRFILRRDRIRILVWLVVLTFFTVSAATSLPTLYLTAEQRQSRAALMNNPATLAISGPAYGMDNYTFGAMMANEMLGFTAIAVALMSLFMVVRHTRAEEESGRAELVRAGVVGRHAHLAAALVVAIATNVVLGLLIAGSLASANVETITPGSSLLYGAALASVGVAFAGIAAVTAQINEHSRGASGLAGIALGVVFALRAAGDMGDNFLRWLSPIGWAQGTRAYVDDRWWPLLLSIALTGALGVVALVLNNRRDLGAGMVAQRPGPATASPALAKPLGFALRLHRATLLAWAGAMLAYGAVYGTMIGEVESFVTDNPTLEEFLVRMAGVSLIDSFLAMIVSLIAIVSTIYVIQGVLRLRAEENAGRAEPLLATPLTRTRWVAGHVTVALIGGAVIVILSAVGLGLSASVTTGDWNILPKLIGASLAYIPAMWVCGGFALALFGLAPRLASAAWLILAYGMTLGFLGGLLQLPDWLNNLSPFTHVPLLPGAELTLTPLALLTAVAAVLMGLGFAGFNRRDLNTT